MRKLGLGILISLVISILAFGVVFALPPNQGTEIAAEKSVAIDDVSGDVEAPPSFVQDLPESRLNKVIFIRYAPGKATCGNGICEPGENYRKCPKDCPPPTPTPTPTATPMPTPTPTLTPTPTPATSCYGFLSGAKPKWNWVENYVYAEGLATVTRWATDSWDGLTSADVFGIGAKAYFDWGVYDGYNAVSFGDYSDPDVLAVTALWYLGSSIYEYDIMFDSDYFPNGQEGAYDLETVALHEFGHAAGLDDLYTTACSNQVMYGYLSPGEIRTTFGNGDITGIQILYGP